MSILLTNRQLQEEFQTKLKLLLDEYSSPINNATIEQEHGIIFITIPSRYEKSHQINGHTEFSLNLKTS